jgi:hypothetical protein
MTPASGLLVSLRDGPGRQQSTQAAPTLFNHAAGFMPRFDPTLEKFDPARIWNQPWEYLLWMRGKIQTMFRKALGRPLKLTYPTA